MLGALVLVLVALSVPIGILARKPVDPLALLGVLVAALGLLIARRQPGNRIGLLLTGFGALLVFYEDAARYAVAEDDNVHHGTLPLGFPAVLIASELWSGLFLFPPLIILLFPDGTLPPRWRTVSRAYLALCSLIIAILLGSGAWQIQGIRIAVQSNGQLVDNSGPSGALGFVLLAAFSGRTGWFLGLVCHPSDPQLAAGDRRAPGPSSSGSWPGSVATVIGLAGTFLLQSITGLLGALDNAMLGIGIFSLPVCITFAISKYHLYDIDRIISRTLAYAVVTGVLVGLYAALVLLATRLLSFQAPVAVAASTLAAAALFNPLRHRVQLRVDRRFNRTRYDADQMVAAFAARLKDTVDLDSVRDDLAVAVHQALMPGRCLGMDQARQLSPLEGALGSRGVRRRRNGRSRRGDGNRPAGTGGRRRARGSDRGQRPNARRSRVPRA